MKNLLFSLCCCIALGNLCRAQEFPHSYEMYDIHFNLEGTKISRDYVLHETVNFIAPNYETIQSLYCNDYEQGDPFLVCGNVVFTLLVDEMIYHLLPGENIELQLTPGNHVLNAGIEFVEENCPDNTLNEFTIQIRKSDNPYIIPDDVWEISLDQDFIPPVNNPYPENSKWIKYNGPSNGKAIATIKLGEGNTNLTRPIIFVDGIDFGEYEILDPNIGKVVRYGSTGWENVSQGLLSKKTEEGELELFENYPNILNNLLSEQDVEDESNYDVILVEFEDGADYIQKNALLLKKVIEKVNAEKECGYENILLGLSMGGQVSRFALRYLEVEGIDHQCRQYISFDSPHIYANIPLAVQAFVYSGAFFLENKTAQENWYGLNRPAAIQMLKYNLMGEIEKGTIEYAHENYSYSLDPSDLLVEHIENIPFLSGIPKVKELRQQFNSERSTLGFPKMAEKIAVANGSGFGSNLFNSEVLAFLKNESDNIIWNPLYGFGQIIIDHIIENNEDEFFKLKLNAVGTDQQNIFEFNFFNQEDLEFNKVRITNNTDLWEIDNAPGCSRDDLKTIIFELEELVKNGATSTSGWSSLFLNFKLELYEKQISSTFMPTASVIGLDTSDLETNLKYEYEFNNLKLPFDFIHLPESNEPHVYANAANESFILSHINDNIWQYGDEFVIPDTTYGNTYNYGYLQNRLRSFTLNKGGKLKINNDGATGFSDFNPEHSSNKADFTCSTIISNCNIPAQITINSGGVFELGDFHNDKKSGHLNLLEGSNLTISEGGIFEMNNGSTVNIFSGAQVTLETGSNILFNGDYSKVVVKKGAKLIINSGLNLEFVGEHASIEVEEGGHIQFVGDHQLDLPKNTNQVIVDGKFEYDGKFKISGEGHIILGKNIEILDHIAFNVLGSSKEINSIITYGTPVFKESLQIQHCGIEGSLMSVSGSINKISDCKIIGGRLSFTNYTSTSIVNSDFSSAGVSRLGNGGNIEILNCTFKINPNQLAAIDIENENSFGGLYVSESVFEEKETGANGFAALELYNLPFVWLDNIQIRNQNYGLIGGDLPNVKITGSKVEDCIEGFRFFYNSNLFLEQGTSLIDNEVGVDMTGDYEYGLVSMNCAKIIINEGYKVGIQGKDVLLHIDAYQHAATSDGILRPNTFIRPLISNVSKFFNINYQERNIGLIHAKGNYWNGIDPSKYMGGAWVVEPFVPVDYSNFVEEMPMACASFEGGGDSGIYHYGIDNDYSSSTCEMIFKEGDLVQDQFTDANQNLLKINFDSAYLFFGEISELSESDQIENQNCKQYIDVSRAISHLYAGELEEFENRSKTSKNNNRWQPEISLKISPNPVSGIVNISTGALKDVELYVININGQVIYSELISDQLTLDISNWHRGIYIIKYFDKESALLYQDKLIVQ